MSRKRRLRPVPLSRAGDHGHKAGRAGGGGGEEEGEGMEEETPEARGEEGRPSPSAWVRGRGVRLEAALRAPMVVQLARRLGRAFLWFTSAPGPPRAPANQTPLFV